MNYSDLLLLPTEEDVTPCIGDEQWPELPSTFMDKNGGLFNLNTESQLAEALSEFEDVASSPTNKNNSAFDATSLFLTNLSKTLDQSPGEGDLCSSSQKECSFDWEEGDSLYMHLHAKEEERILESSPADKNSADFSRSLLADGDLVDPLFSGESACLFPQMDQVEGNSFHIRLHAKEEEAILECQDSPPADKNSADFSRSLLADGDLVDPLFSGEGNESLSPQTDSGAVDLQRDTRQSSSMKEALEAPRSHANVSDFVQELGHRLDIESYDEATQSCFTEKAKVVAKLFRDSKRRICKFHETPIAEIPERSRVVYLREMEFQELLAKKNIIDMNAIMAEYHRTRSKTFKGRRNRSRSRHLKTFEPFFNLAPKGKKATFVNTTKSFLDEQQHLLYHAPNRKY